MNKPNPKPVFDLVRRMLGRGFRANEVAALDAAFARSLEGRLTPEPPSRPEQSGTPHKTGPRGIALLHSFEGYARRLPDGRCQAYPDPGTGGAPWTIGWGATTDENHRPIAPGTIWTRQRADARFEQHLRQFEQQVVAALGSSAAATSQGQFDAMVSFTYNVGPANFARSTLLRKHKAGDYAGAAREFVKWNRAAGRVMRGLTRRRNEEAAVYRSGT